MKNLYVSTVSSMNYLFLGLVKDKSEGLVMRFKDERLLNEMQNFLAAITVDIESLQEVVRDVFLTEMIEGTYSDMDKDAFVVALAETVSIIMGDDNIDDVVRLYTDLYNEAVSQNESENEQVFVLHAWAYKKDEPVEFETKAIVENAVLGISVITNALRSLLEECYSTQSNFSDVKKGVVDAIERLENASEDDVFKTDDRSVFFEAGGDGFLIQANENDSVYFNAAVSYLSENLNKWDSYNLCISVTDKTDEYQELVKKDKRDLAKLAITA